MKLKLLSFVLASGVLISSCKKSDTVDPVDNKAIDEITAPSTFMWSGSRDVSLSIGISDNAFGNQIHVIRVYNADPAKGGELVTTGSATLIT
ncbi:MAG: LruC domain-containing protein, partial [Pedobacter sp.]